MDAKNAKLRESNAPKPFASLTLAQLASRFMELRRSHFALRRTARLGNNRMEIIGKIAAAVKGEGGRALLVGGCVRDELSGEKPKDYDIEVFGLDGETLEKTLKEICAVDSVGKSFGVFKLHHYDVDVALPRRETKLGLGHKAFAIESEPGLGLAEAAARRDFTINAIYRDPLTGEILDPWGGREDLANGVLRHVSEHFSEDPLRVLRGMQFVARFDLEAAPETVGICRSMTPENLPPERLFEEWKKLIIKGKKISKGLNFLRRVGWVKYYPELERLIGCRQAKEWHPEGDVWNHTLYSLDAFAAQRDASRASCLVPRDSGNGKENLCIETENTEYESRDTKNEEEDLIVGLAVLCHDFGKPLTSYYDKRKNRIRSPGHDVAGEKPTIKFLKRLTNEERILREVPPLVKCHMRPYSMWKSKSKESAVRRLAATVGRIDRLIRVCAADDAGRPPIKSDPSELKWLAAEAERLKVKDAAPKPILMGRHLIALGMEPGVEFGRILKEAYEAQLDGKLDDYLTRHNLAISTDGDTSSSSTTHEARDTKHEAPDTMHKAPGTRHKAPGTYILWDWNGTLLDDTKDAFDTLNIMLEKRGAKKIEMQFYLDNFSFPVRPFYEAIGMVLENEDWDALAQEYHDIYHAQKSKRLNPQALEALEIAKAAGVGQSIISALRQDLLEAATREYGIREYLEFVAGVDNLDGASKTGRAKRLLDNLRKLHPQIARYVMIGDALHDKEVADELGIECILCGQGSHAAWRLRKVATTTENLTEAVKMAIEKK